MQLLKRILTAVVLIPVVLILVLRAPVPVVAMVAALVGSALFFGDNNVSYHSYSIDFSTPSLANLWSTGTPGAMSDSLTAAPVVNGGLVIGAAGANDGALRAFASTDGSILNRSNNKCFIFINITCMWWFKKI